MELQIQPLETAEQEAKLCAQSTQAFNFPEAAWHKFLPLLGRENVRIALAGTEQIGGMAYYPVGQWFAGQRLPMAGIALVQIAPECRGHGYARSMLRQLLNELRDDGFPLATLYASTQPVYRKLGFEQAGNSYDYALSMHDVGLSHSTVPVRRIDPDQEPALLQRLALHRARTSNGCLDRNEGMWKRVWLAGETPVFSYAFGPAGQETGYLVYDQQRQPGRSSPGEQLWEQRCIRVRDMVATDRETQQAIWAFLAGHKSVTELIKWSGAASDWRHLVTPEFQPKLIRPRRWMLRVLDVQQALLQRGYPAIDAELSFEVKDAVIPANQGTYTLRLSGGQPQVTHTAETDQQPTSVLRLDVQGLAPLFTGLWSAEELVSAGLLASDSPQQLSIASRVFAGPEPWMPDSF